MKKKIAHIALLSATVALAGCNDWLDMNPTDKVSEKIVWSDPTYLRRGRPGGSYRSLPLRGVGRHLHAHPPRQ